MTDIFTHKKRSEIMSRVRNKNTDIELLLRKSLWVAGYHYRVNYKKVIGKPDVAFPSYKVAVFCDGDFWHGKNYGKEGKNYKRFWKDKIGNNIKRDKSVNIALKKQGWKVIRFWKSDILRDIKKCTGLVIKRLESSGRVSP